MSIEKNPHEESETAASLSYARARMNREAPFISYKPEDVRAEETRERIKTTLQKFLKEESVERVMGAKIQNYDATINELIESNPELAEHLVHEMFNWCDIDSS